MKFDNPEIYGEIEDHEFRGENFFYATYVANTQWVDAVPPDWKVLYHIGDRLILEKLDDEWYKVQGVKPVRGGGVWGIPFSLEQAKTHYYRVHRDWLDYIYPRAIGGE